MPGPVNPPPIQRRQRLATPAPSWRTFSTRPGTRPPARPKSRSTHHLLLAVHAHPQDHPGVAMVADHLALRGNSAAELVNRTVDAGYLRRAPHPQDRRRVQLHLITQAEQDSDAHCRPQLADLSDLLQALTR